MVVSLKSTSAMSLWRDDGSAACLIRQSVRPQLGRIEDTCPREQQDQPCSAEAKRETSEEFANHVASS